MKKIIIICFAINLTIGFKAFSQIEIFKEGQIITKANDTINALVELSISYHKSVSYKDSENSTIRKIKLSDILSLKTPYNFYRNFKVEDKEYLFREAIKGKFLLLEYVQITSSGTTVSSVNMTWEGHESKNTYILITDSTEYILHDKKDLEKISQFISKCPEANTLVTTKSFSMNQFGTVVTRLNSCE